MAAVARVGAAGRRLSIGREGGKAHITVKVVKYGHFELVTPALSAPPSLPTNISKVFSLNMLYNHEVEPSHFYIFNHPSNPQNVMIKQGTGIFSIQADKSQLATTELEKRAITVTPKHAGTMKISVTDICLHGSTPRVVDAIITKVGKIEVDVRDKVQEGNTILGESISWPSLGNNLTLVAGLFLERAVSVVSLS